MRSPAFPHRWLRAAACAALLALPTAAHAQGAPVATVNGTPIRAELGELMFKDQAQNSGGRTPEQIRNAVRDDLINREVIAQEARRTGLLKKPELDTRYELAQQIALVQLFMRDWIATNPVSEQEMRKAYDDAVASAPDKEYKARHILLGTEAEAQKTIAELKKGLKFEELARLSKDAANANSGGDLGWTVPSALDKAFADALQKLGKGQVSEAPVRTRFGWHVIRLDDTRALKMPPFETLKPRIMQQLTQRKIENMVRDLRAKAKIE